MRRLSYANVVATLALFIALGGGAYAATKLPKNSVGPTQLRRNAVTSSKVKDGSLHRKDFATKDLASLRGPTGATGAIGAQGAKGDAGRSALTPLNSGETEHGVFGASGTAAGASAQFATWVSLPIPAPTPIDNAHMHIKGEADPGGVCTGTYADPTAPAGTLCLYPVSTANVSSRNVFAPDSFPTPYGFAFDIFSTAAGVAAEQGSWAYTAP